MIEVKIQSKDSKFVSLEISGHANSAQYGHDLVCAGVSAVVTGAFNALENTKGFKIKLLEGYAYLEAKEKITKNDEIVIKTLIIQLKTIRESNKQFIKITNL